MSEPTTAPNPERAAPPEGSATPAAVAQDVASGSQKTPGARKVSREFLWVIAFLVLVAVGSLGFRSWQQAQKGPDLDFAREFVKANLESPVPPHLARAAINGQVAAFYKENGPATGIVSNDIGSKFLDPFGDPVSLTNTMVSTKNGPVLVHVKVMLRKGERSILSFVYEPQQ